MQLTSSQITAVTELHLTSLGNNSMTQEGARIVCELIKSLQDENVMLKDEVNKVA